MSGGVVSGGACNSLCALKERHPFSTIGSMDTSYPGACGEERQPVSSTPSFSKGSCTASYLC